jgi:predicted dehydrogenase
VAQLEKLRVFDARVERPPHYDTFAEFQYAYHYGDMYVPYIKQEEPLKAECQHFLDCIHHGTAPMTSGQQGLELVRILEASSVSLRHNGAAVDLRGQLIESNPVKHIAKAPLDMPHPAQPQKQQVFHPAPAHV